MTENLSQLPFSFEERDGKKSRLPPPAVFRHAFTISCGMSARNFFALVTKHYVTHVVDTRIGRDYQGAYWSREDDFRYLCERHEVVYSVMEDVAPTREIRETFAKTFQEVRSAKDRSPDAWTVYLESYAELLRSRKVLREGSPLRAVVDGKDVAVAFVCACQHPLDCHRHALGQLFTRYVMDVELVDLTQVHLSSGPAPSRKSPRRILVRDIPFFGLQAERGKR